LKIDTGIDAPSFQELPRVLNRKILWKKSDRVNLALEIFAE
jgi:hypothetical protein